LPCLGFVILSKNKVAGAPPFIHEGSKEEDTEASEVGAALNNSVVYLEIDPSLKTTVYIFGEVYVGMPITVAIDGGE
jgi:hypothetical protein